VKKLGLYFFVLLSLMPLLALAAPAHINKVRLAAELDKTRLVFDLNKPVQHKVMSATNQAKIILYNAKLASNVDLHKLSFTKSPIHSLATTQVGHDLVMLITLDRRVTITQFTLTNPDRLVIDLTPIINIEMPPGLAANATNNPTVAAAVTTAEESLTKEKFRDVIVVIDPGHGGKDPGAVGRRGTKEKTIVLAIAKYLQQSINKTRGFKAVLTRNDDHFISLRQRLNIAHQYKADMFIAIHADAYRFANSRGASVFALSQRGATSEAARWLAEKENESELGQAMSDKSAVLRSVLIDLAQTATVGASLEIGNSILQGLERFTCLHSAKVEQAAFVVLKSPDIPSLLVETGFVSDKSEEAKLRDSSYQKKIADALSDGIKNYFIHKPPPGTYLGIK
jgi:N-acetylmuramoyl-L-alanine amidase